MKKPYSVLVISLCLIASIMYAPAVIAADERTVTFWERGVDFDFTGPVCIVDDVGATVVDLHTCYTVIKSTAISFVYQSPLLVDSSKRYVWIYTTSDTIPPITTQGGTIPAETAGNVYGFYETQYKVSFSSNVNGGTISPSGSDLWTVKGALSISATPRSGYSFVSWASTGSIVIDNPNSKIATATIDGPGAITANFVEQTVHYTIRPYVSGEGTISPSVATRVEEGGSQTFTFEPVYGFSISQILVDGAPVQNAPYYTFTNVRSDHTLNVTFEATVRTSVTVDSTPSGSGFVSVDGNLTTTPRIFSWLPGSTHTVSAIESVMGDTGTRYNFISWSDGGAITHNYTVTETSDTIVANYQTQYLLNVKSNFGSVVPQDGTWYDAGTRVTVYTEAPSVVSGESFVFGGWKGSLGGYSGGKNPSDEFVMNGPVTEETMWQHSYELRIESAYGETNYAGWYEVDQPVKAAVLQTEVVEGNVKAIFVGWAGDATGAAAISDTIIMNGPKIAKAEWSTEYRVVFSQNGLEGGTFGVGDESILTVNGTNVSMSGLPYTSNWINEGGSLSYTFKDNVASLLGTHFVLSNSASLVSPVGVNGPVEIVASYANSGFVITWLNGLLVLLLLALLGGLFWFFVMKKKSAD